MAASNDDLNDDGCRHGDRRRTRANEKKKPANEHFARHNDTILHRVGYFPRSMRTVTEAIVVPLQQIFTRNSDRFRANERAHTHTDTDARKPDASETAVAIREYRKRRRKK
jgi:hypothetical protein